MPQRAGWTYSGSIELTNDLSVLESELHAGRVAAAEQGYDDEPDSIDVDEAMLAGENRGLLSAAEAADAGLEFRPTHTRFVMSWHARS